MTKRSPYPRRSRPSRGGPQDDPLSAAEERALLQLARKAAKHSNRHGWIYLKDAREISKW